jgi:hypothetical protein
MTSGPPGSKYFGTETAPSAPVFSDYAARRWCGVQSPVPCEELESCCDRDTRDLGSRTSRRPGRRVDGRATPEPNRAEIRAAAPSTCDDTEGPRSVDQPLNSASFHSVEGMHNVALVEHGEQALDSAHRVVLARCDIFRQDATCIFHRAQYRFLIGRVQTELLAQQSRGLKRRPADSFQSFLCVMRGGPSPVQRVSSTAASLRDKDMPLHGPWLQALRLPIDRVNVNAVQLPGPRFSIVSWSSRIDCPTSEVIVQCSCRSVDSRYR